MSDGVRYPRINLGSKNELAKRISGKNFSYQAALALVNDVLENHNIYWYDSDRSEPEKGKYVRSAVKSPLGKLLKRIDKKILRPHDHLVPNFIFGGLSKRNHVQATQYLLGTQRGRVLVGLDISRFFEQIQWKRVFYFFHKHCGCSVRASRLLADLCCVPLGPKGSQNSDKTLARGFATSSRLAVWCNLTTFQRLEWKVKRRLRGHDPRVTIFVDDLGVTASHVTTEEMEQVSAIAENILANFDHSQKLPINPNKKKNQTFADGAEHLGLRFGRNRVTIGGKTRSKRDKVRAAIRQSSSNQERKRLQKKNRSYYGYQQQLAGEG